jgi:hypothetical protein
MTDVVFGNIFQEIDEEKDVYNKIKYLLKDYDVLDANLAFNYFLYSSVYFYTRKIEEDIDTYMIKTLLSFIIKDIAIQNSLAVINNTYQITSMQNDDLIIKLLMGQQSNFLQLNSDAAKLGALLALSFKHFGISKKDMFHKALLFAENMV